MDSSPTSTKAIIGIIVVVLLVVAATAAVIATGNNKDNITNDATTALENTATNGQPPEATSSITNLNDGTYTTSADYATPGGVQEIKVTLTISKGVVSNSVISHVATAREDEEYQSAFDASYKTQVVGKKISDISLHRVAGASLTTDGFNSALLDIAKQAQA